jgi:hypothetical protein
MAQAPHHGAGASGAHKEDIVSRLSFVSGTSQTKDVEEGYKGAQTPDADGLFEGGALRPGGKPNLLSKDYFGFIMQYAAIGLVYGLLPATVYPVLQNYFNAEGSVVSTAATLVVLPWSFKAFYGVLSDCVPIFGLRRKPWMIIGWSICIIMLIVMACLPEGDPYFTVPSDAEIKPEDYTPEIEARINYEAPNQAGKYVMLMFFAAFGYVLSDVCADSMVVELAQREPLEVRGKTQSAIYAVRTAVVILGQILVGFGFNGEKYGGDFDFSLTFSQLMIIVTVCTCPILPVTWFFIKEEKSERVHFHQYLKDMWSMIQRRAFYQLIFFNFFQGLFSSISYTANSPVQSRMVGVTPLNATLSDILSNLMFMLGIMVTSKWGLGWSWRWMIIATGAFVIVVDAVTSFITIWDVFRSQWFWLGPPVAVMMPYGVGWIISCFFIVELASVGNEGLVYGLITTTSNLSGPFAQTLTLVIDKPFNLTTVRIQNDDNSIRWDLTYAIIIMYTMTVFSWIFLVFLPRQKAETQELIRKGGSSKWLGGLTVFYLTFAFVWSIMTNIMAIFESTSCLVIAGGGGC